ncbi:hypothetical protein A2U01_0008781, partial [Trifolium medium]|nr:hypothetical protein [Trifolium medium]
MSTPRRSTKNRASNVPVQPQLLPIDISSDDDPADEGRYKWEQEVTPSIANLTKKRVL